MNYEEKYNEILEWARKNKARLNGVPIEEVLPELAESEDERIREDIIKYLKLVDKGEGDYAHPIVSGWIAYLEKQKDINCLACDQHLKGYLAGRKVTEEEKQKEQKPEWNEEDENMRESAIALIRKWTNYSGENVGDSIKVISWLQWLPLLAHQH